MKHLFLLFTFLLLSPEYLPGATNIGQTPAKPMLDAAFNRLYNYDFVGSQRLLQQYTAEHPDDPLGYAIQGNAYLYAELSRLNVLGKDVLTSDEKIRTVKQLQPDPVVRDEFFKATAEAQRRAQLILEKNPQDANALLALCLTAGAQRDFTALVEKKLRLSLNYARESQAHAVQLLRVAPQTYDAYLTTGFSEYLLGTLPFFVKWVVKFDEVQGNKELGLKNLEVVARSGHYMRPFAQMLLAMFYLREKRPADSERLLAQLSAEFPENLMIRRELAKLKQQPTP